MPTITLQIKTDKTESSFRLKLVENKLVFEGNEDIINNYNISVSNYGNQGKFYLT